jgi:hypothetical protein
MAHDFSQQKQEPRILYRRPLPGGGYVNVEEESAEASLHRGHVAVERRADPERREGHEPPIIATAEGTSAQSVLRQLFEIASDNVAIARALLRWRSDGRARF